MCNCGCDSHDDEARKLQRSAVLSACGAVILAGLIPLFAQQHAPVVAAIIVAQVLLLVNAGRLIARRRRLLQSN